MNKQEQANAMFDIVHKDLEPGIINDDMLQRLILEQGFKGEAGRLARLNPIDYNIITVLRIEFQNLLKVDHLWVLPNLEKLSLKFNKLDRIENMEMLCKLKDLDLSFNHIEKIEGLETLVNLEILSLFNNKIKKLENLDSLSKLLILSIGNNEIDTYDGIERLRFMKELRSLNLEGNTIAQRPIKDTTFRIYIAAFLPNLKYYNYMFIMNDERTKGQFIFKLELRQLTEAQLTEVKEREKIAKALADELRLSSSFVELLNEHQLFDSLFENDEDGKLLLSIGEDAEELAKEYRMEIYDLTQQIYKLGLEKHIIRLEEIQLFEKAVDDGKLKAQQEGIKIVNEFLEQKVVIFEKAKDVLASLEDELEPADGGVDLDEEFKKIKDDFMAMIDRSWHTLMEMEVQLFENIEDANNHFGHVVQEMLNEFIEAAQTLFVQMRDAEINFSDSIFDTVSRFITTKAAAGDIASIPEGLQECLEDKDAIVTIVAGSKDHHMQVIDAREDRLVTRAKKWANELVANMQSDEINRNRTKVMEINYFLDHQREEFHRIQEEIENEKED